MPKVSLVVPVRNGEAYLQEALESIVKQTFTDWECIVWDDGSTDQSRAIASSFMQGDSRFRVYVGSKPEGLPQALNHGYLKSSGLYLGQVDSDDKLLPSALDETVNFLDTHQNIALVFTSAFWLQGVTAHWGWRCKQDFSRTDLLLSNTFVPPHFRLMRQKAYLHIGGYREDIQFAEDFDFCLRLMWGIHSTGLRVSPLSIRYYDSPLYLYRIHPKSMVQQAIADGKIDDYIEGIRDDIRRRVLWRRDRFWRIGEALEWLAWKLYRLDSGKT